MKLTPLIMAMIASLSLAGCQLSEPGPPQDELDFLASFADAPEDAPPGTCWGKIIKPAVIETVVIQEIITPEIVAEDGTILESAKYRTKEMPQIAQERSVDYFEAPCVDDLVEDFNATLQRALAARGAYDGQINGLYDQRLAGAVRAYQTGLGGPASGTLSLATARQLGLVPVERPTED